MFLGRLVITVRQFFIPAYGVIGGTGGAVVHNKATIAIGGSGGNGTTTFGLGGGGSSVVIGGKSH